MQTGQENSRAHLQVLRRPGPDGGFPLVLTGVCQLVNKRDESTGEARPFSRSDEQFLEAFVIFCGLGIQNTQMYEAVERAMAQQMVTLEVGQSTSRRSTPVLGLRGSQGDPRRAFQDPVRSCGCFCWDTLAFLQSSLGIWPSTQGLPPWPAPCPELSPIPPWGYAQKQYLKTQTAKLQSTLEHSNEGRKSGERGVSVPR